MEPHNHTPSKVKESPSPQSPTVLSLSPIPQSAVMADTLQRSTSDPFPASATDSSEKLVVPRSFLPHNPNRPPPHSYQRLHEFPPFPPLTQHPVLPFITTAFSNTRVQHGDKPFPSSAVKAKPLAPRASTTQRHVQSNISTIPTMDVSKNDPNAIFIRSPWVVPYPQSKEGRSRSNENEPIPGTPLTYALMHTHLNWFLDADDFQKDNPNRVDYPPELEPPRGWAPLTEAANQAKQAKEIERNNNIRTKGSYAPGNDSALEYGPLDECHEKTVLRCTFCRREYHGPNAKSMWRRHVFDKHKVAMKNRREGSAGSSRSGARKTKPKPDGTPQATPTLASPHLDTPALTLDLTNEQNLVRLLERVISGNANISLPSALFSQGPQNIDLEAITEILRKSGLSVILQKDLPSEECFVTPPTTDGESSQDSSSTPLKQRAIESVSPRFFVAEESPPAEHQRNPLLWHSHKDEDTDVNAHMSTVWDRAPLKDSTVADRNYHNTPGTPGKDKGKQKALPLPRTPNGSKISSIYPSPSLHRNPFTSRHLPSTAMRARALATTGQESYLIASSPALSSPLRGLNRTMLTPGSPSKSKSAGHTLSNDDLAVLLSPYRGMTESENAYLFDSVPLEVSSVRRSNWSPTTSLGPPARLSVKRPRSKSRIGARRVQDDDLELQYPPKTSPHKEDHDMEPAYNLESSPLESVQRRRSAADTKMHMNGFNLNDFLDLDDIASGLASSAPSSPHKPSLPREFSKEFGLLSREEVDRLTGSTCFEEEARSSKRRKVDLTH